MHNYSINKQRAIEEMLDMNKRAAKKCLNSDTLRQKSIVHHKESLDFDVIIILTLMFILYNNSGDMILIFALAYILI